MTRHDQADDPRAGFALVDMLVALVLLGLLTGLMAAFFIQFRSIQRMQSTVAVQMEVDAIVGYLENAIGGAMSTPFVDNAIEGRDLFEGTPSSLRFVTIARQGARSFGLRETSLQVRQDDAGFILVQRFSPRRGDAGQRLAATTSVDIASGLTRLSFRYLTYDPTTHAPLWIDNWDSKHMLPAAVRIDLSIERNGATVNASGDAILTMYGGPPLTVVPPGGEL